MNFTFEIKQLSNRIEYSYNKEYNYYGHFIGERIVFWKDLNLVIRMFKPWKHYDCISKLLLDCTPYEKEEIIKNLDILMQIF